MLIDKLLLLILVFFGGLISCASSDSDEQERFVKVYEQAAWVVWKDTMSGQCHAQYDRDRAAAVVQNVPCQ